MDITNFMFILILRSVIEIYKYLKIWKFSWNTAKNLIRIHSGIYENLEYLEIKQATITIKFRRFNSYTAKGLVKFNELKDK